jgi:hypothetical protein
VQLVRPTARYTVAGGVIHGPFYTCLNRQFEILEKVSLFTPCKHALSSGDVCILDYIDALALGSSDQHLSWRRLRVTLLWSFPALCSYVSCYHYHHQRIYRHKDS